MTAVPSIRARLDRRRRRLRDFTVGADVPALPSTPGSLAAANGVSDVAWSWSDDPDGLAESWELEVRAAPSASATLLRTVSDLASPAYTDSAASLSANEYGRVRAVGADGTSPWSAFVGAHRLTAGSTTPFALEVYVGGTDDGTWVPATSGFASTSTDLFFGKNGSNSQHAWLRVVNTGASIAAGGATVESFLIAGTAKGTANNTTVNGIVRLVDAANPAAPTTAAEAEAWTLTTAGVDWDVANTTVWTAGDAVQSPECAAVLQEVIDTHGWASGEAIIIVIRDDGSASSSRRNLNSGNIGTESLRPRITISATLDAGAASDTVAPAAPSGLAVVNTSGGPYLTWTANVENDIAQYPVERSTTSGSGFSEIGTSTTNSYTDATAASGTTYYYRLRAADSSNASDPSSEVTITTSTVVPTGDAIGIDSGAVAWEAGYRLITVDVPFTGDDNASATDGTLTTEYTLTTSGASIGATTLPCSVLPIALPNDSVLLWLDSGVVKLARLSAAAAKGATSLSVDALAAGITSAATARFTGVQFRPTAVANDAWRFGLPLARTDDGTTRRLTGAVFSLDPNTEYELRVTISDADAAGDTILTQTLATYATPDLSATYAGRNKLLGSGGDWTTLAAMVTDLNTSAWWTTYGSNSVVIGVANGYYQRATTTLAVPSGKSVTLVAQSNALDANRAVNGASWPVVYEQFISPTGTTDAASLVDTSGVNVAWTETGVGTDVWQANVAVGAALPALQYVGYSDTKGGTLTKVPVWKRDALMLDTITDAATLIQGNDAFNWGAWQASDDTIYFVAPSGSTFDPTTKWWFLSTNVNGNNSTRPGLDINCPNTTVIGLRFRGLTEGVRVRQAATDCALAYCHDDGCTAGIWGASSSDTSQNADRLYVYRCRFEDSSLWNTSRPDTLIPWDLPKQQIYYSGAYYTTRQIAQKNCETQGIKAARTARFWHIEEATFTGKFNGSGSNNNGPSRQHYWGWYIKGCSYANIADNCIEPEATAVCWVIEGNTFDTSRDMISTDHAYGPMYFLRNRLYDCGVHGLGGDGSGTADQYSGNGGFWKAGTDFTPSPVWFVVHNTFYTASGTAKGISNAIGGGSATEGYWLRNNIMRVAGRIVDRNSTTTLYWNEDYNVFGTGANGEGLRIGTTYTTIASYRTAFDDGDHSNLVGSTSYDFAADGTNPAATKIAAELNGEASGDLTLIVGSAFIDIGVPVPNVSDLSGVNYSGNAPDLGYAEKA